MEPRSILTDLYFTLYGEMPSSHTAAELLRLERFFGLSKDDPLAHMQVVQLRAAERQQQLNDERTAAERWFIDQLQSHQRALSNLTYEVEKTRFRIARKAKRSNFQLTDEDVVLVDRSHWPIFTYLRFAFQLKRGPRDDDERISAARGDLFGIIMILIAVLVLTIALTRALVLS